MVALKAARLKSRTGLKIGTPAALPDVVSQDPLEEVGDFEAKSVENRKKLVEKSKKLAHSRNAAETGKKLVENSGKSVKNCVKMESPIHAAFEKLQVRENTVFARVSPPPPPLQAKITVISLASAPFKS